MTIKEILAKLAKGEALTDEERTALAAFDPDRASNTAAAAARKEAEKQRDALKAQLAELEAKLEEAGSAGKTEVEQLKAQVAKLTKAVDDGKAATLKIESEKKALLRGHKLDKILSGMRFVEGVDSALPRLALEKALAELKDEDLDVEDTVKPIVETFRAKNKAILLDESGGGAGSPAKDKAGMGGTGKPIDKMTPDERRADLKKQGII